ncbi:MAG: alcohol dehydrogenase [Bacteroidetes bacterium GWF2_41_61]|nr:MAG: alcohol dehydrogenase [Bacteroidetes bacterium GWE2_40_15]OFY26911.1 MAG: alcohol dehydrogenase [Bacteroidetes bacterium GWF2_41_61]OFY90774.1 MAG: alcohol dehydrogenase [Bacteroidetes bacterium RIFOXYA12_FULL_40_10]HBG24185.1 alcohol dehydrogenase [Rikenellaceae bacterium]HBZ25592.1 alcohol dehydrogenase [Rikenellaceae bacterium]
MNNFIFHNPTKLIFGKGTIASLSTEIPKERRVLVTFGGGSVKNNGVYDQVKEALKEHTYFEFWGIEPNPTIETLRKAIKLGKEKSCDFVLAVGGGSVADGSKLIASGILYDGEPWDIVIKREYSTEKSLPLACVLTLPATGSEMNRGAVISKKETNEKFAFYSNTPLFSILDPQTTYTLPDFQISCGLADTFVHVIEQYLTTPGQSPLMDRWAEGILKTIVEIAPRIIDDRTNYDDMATFMLSATMALNGFISMGVTQDWATHMIGHELTALHGLTHAHTLAIILPGTMWVMRSEKGDKMIQYGKRVFGVDIQDRDEAIVEIIRRTEDFFLMLGFKIKLSENGVTIKTIDEIERRFTERNYKLGENRSVTPAVAREILERVF